jgi:uncharacterized pyridoxal phosphate-containing UPF0001 family protein
LRWHFLGPVQRNKVRPLAPFVALWQTMDRLAAAEAVARHSPGAAVLAQVNTAGDPAKHGCAPEEVPSLVEGLRALGLDVRGLMTVAPAGPAALARRAFRELAAIGRGVGLSELSMGMTDDLEEAVAEGSTMIRIGRGLFGPRPTAARAPARSPL